MKHQPIKNDDLRVVVGEIYIHYNDNSKKTIDREDDFDFPTAPKSGDIPNVRICVIYAKIKGKLVLESALLLAHWSKKGFGKGKREEKSLNEDGVKNFVSLYNLDKVKKLRILGGASPFNFGGN